MRNIAACQIPCLATHFHSLDEVEHSVMDALSRDETKCFCMSQGKTIHRVDIVCSKASHELLLSLTSTLVDLLKAKSLVMQSLAFRHVVWICG